MTTQLTLIKGDITNQSVDAIVNAANASLMGGGGVDGAIHRKGGAAILDACKEIRRTQWRGGLPTGKAVLTTAGALPAQAVIHTVGPIYKQDRERAPSLLRACVSSSLTLAHTSNLRTIAFPAISTGVYGYPMREAATLMRDESQQYIDTHPEAFDEIRFVLFDDRALQIFQDVWS